MVEIITTHVEEIEKKFRGQLSPQAIEVIVRIHEETRVLEKAVSDVVTMINTLKEAMALNMALNKQINQKMKAFEHKYTEQFGDMVKNEPN